METITNHIARLRSRLGTRIIAWSFFPTAIILAAVALVTLRAYGQVTEHLVLQRDRELARLSASQVAAELDGYVDLLTWVARIPDLSAVDVRARQEALHAARPRLLAFDGGAVLVDASGTVVATDPERPEVHGKAWADRAYVARAMALGRPVFSDLVADGPGGAECIALAVPISADGPQRQGILVGMLRVARDNTTTFYGGLRREFGRWVNVPEDLSYVDASGRLRQAPTGALSLSRVLLEPRLVGMRLGSSSVYLVDGSGRVIYHSDVTRVGEQTSSLPTAQRALQQRVGAERVRSPDGTDTVISYAPVPDTGWAFVSEIGWSSLAGASEMYRRFLLALLVAGVIVPALLVTWRVQRLTHPLADLGDAAQQVTEGRFGHQIAVRTGDEIEDLAERFNAMSRHLEESYSNLEQRVAARTTELATLNAVATVASRSLDVRQILSDALRITLEFAHMRVGEAFELCADGDSLDLIAQQGLSDEARRRRERVPLMGSWFGESLDAGRPAVISLSDEGPQDLSALYAQGLRQCVSVPLMAHGQAMGLMTLSTATPRDLGAHLLSLLGSIGQQVGVTVENARLYRQAEATAAMAERGRLARDLHDAVAQQLYGLTLYARAAARLLEEGDRALALEHLGEVEEAAQQALQEMRLLIYELHPPILEEQGLITALRGRLEAVEERSGLETALDVTGRRRPSPDVEEALYRVAQEALNNALKHARPHRVCLRLALDSGSTVLEVADDGAGFDPAAVRDGAGMGLRSMEERVARLGGSVQIDSRRGEGTCIRVEVPT